MNKDEPRGTTGSVRSMVQAPAGLQRVRSRRDGMLVALWALTIAGYVVLIHRFGTERWIETYGLMVIAAWVLLGVLIRIIQARVRTVRPRHYRSVEGLAALWGAVGASIAVQWLRNDGGSAVPLDVTLVAALVVSAPMLGCALWLMVRGR